MDYNKNMVLIPITIDPFARFGPMLQSFLTSTESRPQEPWFTTHRNNKFSDISDLNLNIVIALDDPCSLTNKFKDKNLTIDAYRGKADTTIRDLINSYTHIFANACLSAVADFIKHTATGVIASDAGKVE